MKKQKESCPKNKKTHPIGFIGAYSIGIGGIVGAGIFATLGLAGGEARGATNISFLIAGLIAMLTAYSYVHLSLTYPGKGGTVTFINKAFGEGTFSGSLNLLLILSYVMLFAVYAYGFASYAANFFPKENYAFWHRLLTSGIIVVLALLNFIGPAIVDKSEGLFNLGKLAILLVFVFVGLFSPSLALERLSPSNWVPTVDIVAAGMLVFFSYEGFELIANASDRVTNKKKNLPLAFYGSILTAIIFYFFIIIVTLGHLSFPELMKSSDYSLSAAAQKFLGRPGFILLSIGAILATASSINAGLFGSSKLPIILAETGEAPIQYDREMWGRYPLGLLVIALLAVLSANFLNLHALSASAATGFILTFAMVNVANAKLSKKTKSRRWVSIIAAAACFIALMMLFIQIWQNPKHRWEFWFIGFLVIFPFIYQYYRALKTKKKQKIH
jgi:uncharacterized protein